MTRYGIVAALMRLDEDIKRFFPAEQATKAHATLERAANALIEDDTLHVRLEDALAWSDEIDEACLAAAQRATRHAQRVTRRAGEREGREGRC
jgi:hypothetical protein